MEPRLLPLSGEALPLRSANTDDQARLDIEAYGFWGSHHERALFDVRVFNPFPRSYMTSPIGTTYRRHERAKVQEYEQRVREIEWAPFTPLVCWHGPASKIVLQEAVRSTSRPTEGQLQPNGCSCAGDAELFFTVRCDSKLVRCSIGEVALRDRPLCDVCRCCGR